jgi:hypothetical protein
MSVETKETAVSLDHLPPGIDFPPTFPEPIRYDLTRRALTYRGVMLNASYTYLRRLSHDAAYQAALDELYVRSAMPERAARAWGWWLLLALVVAGVAALAALWWFRAP